MSARLIPSQKIKLAKLDINEIAKTWEVLSSEDYNNVIRDCLELRNKHQLCDWAYLRMLDKLSSSFLGEDTNEAELFKAFLYCQSGYQMRLAIANNHLYMLYASQHFMFVKPCWKIDDIFYYADNCDAEQIQICEASFPHEQAMSLYIQNEQNLMINVSDKVLDNHTITELSNYKIKLHNDTIIHNDKVYDKLMDKPCDLDDYDFIVMYGRYLHSEIPKDGYPSYWIYPDDWTENIEHIEGKIEDDKLYKVWVDHGYPHDPTDHTEFNYVKYIERTDI